LEKSIDIDIKSVLLQEKYLRGQTIVEGANKVTQFINNKSNGMFLEQPRGSCESLHAFWGIVKGPWEYRLLYQTRRSHHYPSISFE
jgi:hypothetical protein